VRFVFDMAVWNAPESEELMTSDMARVFDMIRNSCYFGFMKVGYCGTFAILWIATFCFFVHHGGLLPALLASIVLALPLTLSFIPLAIMGGVVGSCFAWIYRKRL
jgi:hypothetical protein